MSEPTTIAIFFIWGDDIDFVSIYTYLRDHNIMIFILTDKTEIINDMNINVDHLTRIFSVRSLYDVLVVLKHIELKNEPNVIFYASFRLDEKILFPDEQKYDNTKDFRRLILEQTSPSSQILFISRYGQIKLPYVLNETKRFRLVDDDFMIDRLILQISCCDINKFIECMSYRILDLTLVKKYLAEWNCIITCSYPITPLMFSWVILVDTKISHSLMTSTLIVNKITE